MLVNLNDRLINIKEATISIQNRSFRYGDGFFESIKLFNNKLLLKNLHLLRVENTIHFLELKINNSFIHDLFKKVDELYTYQQIKYGIIKLSIWRNCKTGNYNPIDENTNFLIQINPSKTNIIAYPRNNPISCKTYRKYFIQKNDVIGNYKTTNKLYHILASKQINNSYNDIILLNSTLEVVEATYSNFFLVKNNQIYTPPLSSSCLQGVMRKHIITLAKSKNIKCLETPIHLDTCNEADEIFLTNTTNGIIPVKKLNKQQYNLSTNTVTKYLHNLINR